MNGSYIIGIDIGSRATKVAVITHGGTLCAAEFVRTRPPFAQTIDKALADVLSTLEVQRDGHDYIITTGFGRSSYPERSTQVTDISAAAYGAISLFPKTRCVIDIGSQSSRAIRIDEFGRVKEFKTNDKCAAGAGGFVERAARYLETPIEAVGDLSLAGEDPVTISSVCAVLAESEIINHVSQGRSVQDILHGVHDSLADRAMALLKRVGVESEVTLVGGMARQAGMIVALSKRLGMPINVPESPEIVNALGAALLAKRRLERAAA